MTRNLYLGADLTPMLIALASGNNTAIVGAATQTWAAVQATRPAERMGAIADEIVAADPDAVGLQEVTTWTTFAYNPLNGTTSNPTVEYDFLDLLLDALAERGAGYHEVVGATLTDPDNPLTSRIDLVLYSDEVKAPRATIVGDDPSDMTASGLWPSDHAGVVARLVVPAGRGH